MTTTDIKPGDGPASADESVYPMPGPDPYVDADDPDVDQFDLVREGARRDGVEIIHYRPRFPVPGTKEEKRIERTLGLLLGLAGLFSLAFLALYLWWPYQNEAKEMPLGVTPEKFYTPLLGLTLALGLFFVGVAVIMFAKKLLPEELSVQDRHDGASPDDERRLTGATILEFVDATGIKRRPMLKAGIALGLAPVGAAIAIPMVGGLIKDPKDAMVSTAWRKGIRLTREDGSPVRPADIHAGGIETLFPGIPEGASNKHADSPILLVHLREIDAKKFKPSQGHEKDNYQNFYAYSKICTHAGCPASLYEQQTQRLLCPCHQSQFDVLDACKPIFGPAARRLPQLAIDVDKDGFFFAKGDFKEPIGPSFWELGRK